MSDRERSLTVFSPITPMSQRGKLRLLDAELQPRPPYLNPSLGPAIRKETGWLVHTEQEDSSTIASLVGDSVSSQKVAHFQHWLATCH